MSLRASLSEKEDISLGGLSHIFSKLRKGTLRQYTTSSDSSGLSLELTCEGQKNGDIMIISYLKHHTGLSAGPTTTDLGGILLRRVLDAVCDLIIGAGGETGVAAVLPQLSQVRNVLLPFYQDSAP